MKKRNCLAALLITFIVISHLSPCLVLGDGETTLPETQEQSEIQEGAEVDAEVSEQPGVENDSTDPVNEDKETVAEAAGSEEAEEISEQAEESANDGSSDGFESTQTDAPEEQKPVLRGSVRSAALEITYVNGKYVYDGAEHDTFPVSGDYILGSDVPVYSQISVGDANGSVLSIDLNGYDLIDRSGTNKPFFSVQQNDVLNVTGTSGKIRSEQTAHHTAVYLNNGGTFNFSGGSLEDFVSDTYGGGVDVEHANDVFRMTGTASIKNCGTTYASGGGGINVLRGKFYMTDNASVTECYTSFSSGGEKKGNGAGIQVGTNGSFYLSGNAVIANNHGTGYHGAGVDLWSSGIMYLSGSPTIVNNMNGKNQPVNLYAGSVVRINGVLTGTPDSIGVSVQSNPVFTTGLKEHNPDADIADLIGIFDSDRYYWEDLPRHLEYSIIDQDGLEAKQSPTIMVHFMTNIDDPEAEYKNQYIVPGGYATNPGNPSRTGYNFKGWYTTAAGTGSAWSFNNNNVPVDHDLYLYAKWEKKTYNMTVVVTENEYSDKITTSGNTTVAYGEDWTFTAETEEGYYISAVKIDSTVQPIEGQPAEYETTIGPISSARTVTVTVGREEVTLTLAALDNTHQSAWSCDTPETTVFYGESAELEGTFADGYYVKSITVEGVALPAEQYSIEKNAVRVSYMELMTDIDVVVELEKYLKIDVVKDGSAGYSDETLDLYLAEAGASQTVVLKSADGYFIDEVEVDGVLRSDVGDQTGSYTVSFENISSDHTIRYTVTRPAVMIPEPTGFSDNSSWLSLTVAIYASLLAGLVTFKIINKNDTLEEKEYEN